MASSPHGSPTLHQIKTRFYTLLTLVRILLFYWLDRILCCLDNLSLLSNGCIIDDTNITKVSEIG